MKIYWYKLIKEKGFLQGLEYLTAYIIYKSPFSKYVKSTTIPILPLSYAPVKSRMRNEAIDKLMKSWNNGCRRD